MASQSPDSRPSLPPPIRKSPLSVKDIQDIRRLINVATRCEGKKSVSPPKTKRGPTKSKNISNIQNEIGGNLTTAEPLTGQRVMIPMTSKAFFEGILQPTSVMEFPVQKSISMMDYETKVNYAMNERILVNVAGEHLVEMTRLEASSFFEKKLRLRQSIEGESKRLTRKKQRSEVMNSLDKEKEKDDSQLVSAMEKMNLSKVENDKKMSSVPGLPFMEIREECDSSGNVLHSEVINMSNEMKRLDDKLAEATSSMKDSDQTEQAAEIFASTHDNTITDDKSLTASDANLTESSTSQQPDDVFISDEAYKSLRKRLDELERLEEDAEKSKDENVKSSTRLQSHGWSKGFLNARENKAKNAKRSNIGQQSKKSSKNAILPQTSNSIRGESIVQPSKQNIIAENNVSESVLPGKRKTKVSFANENKVKEIPRIGKSKVPQKSFSTILPISNNSEIPTIIQSSSSPPAAATIPFEERVFSGVVRERNGRANDSFKGERMNEKKAVDRNDVGEKKLSRFAQQRLGRRGY